MWTRKCINLTGQSLLNNTNIFIESTKAVYNFDIEVDVAGGGSGASFGGIAEVRTRIQCEPPQYRLVRPRATHYYRLQ